MGARQRFDRVQYVPALLLGRSHHAGDGHSKMACWLSGFASNRLTRQPTCHLRFGRGGGKLLAIGPTTWAELVESTWLDPLEATLGGACSRGFSVVGGLGYLGGLGRWALPGRGKAPK